MTKLTWAWLFVGAALLAACSGGGHSPSPTPETQPPLGASIAATPRLGAITRAVGAPGISVTPAPTTSAPRGLDCDWSPVCAFAELQGTKVRANGLAAILPPAIAPPALDPPGPLHLVSAGCTNGSPPDVPPADVRHPDCARWFDLVFSSTPDGRPGSVVVVSYGITAALGTFVEHIDSLSPEDLRIAVLGGDTAACRVLSDSHMSLGEAVNLANSCMRFFPAGR